MNAASESYDFSVCKACGSREGIPAYRPKNVVVYVCSPCGFHYTNLLDTPVRDAFYHRLPEEAPRVRGARQMVRQKNGGGDGIDPRLHRCNESRYRII